ncbi:MAG TPA: CehA/McbA family metallohydrolase [Vicinamibacterales bacterium]|nr:CehA/McbA family metallohydrolase [Vicinamibacterales bacterium]
MSPFRHRRGAERPGQQPSQGAARVHAGSRASRIARIVVAAVIVAIASLIAFWLPPASEPLAITSNVPAGVRGAIHIHTRRSDGTGTIDDVAAAAAKAGLKFVVITDHGDGTRQPEPPSYRQGVLCIDAAEISTENGHVVALGLTKTPYPLGGEGRDVIEDIARLGGFSIVAHPGSPKPDLRWTEWSAPFDGIEWLNGDSEWRDETPANLLRSLLVYRFRPAETLGHLLDRPDPVMARWDALTKRRRVVAVAGSDAHARVALRSAPDPYDGSAALRLPGYEQVFRAFSIVVPRVRLSGDATRDATLIVDEIRAGHVFSSIDALASPAAMTFTATSGTQKASGGDVLAIEGPVEIHVASNAPGHSRISLLKDGRSIASSSDAMLEFTAPPEPAVYRAEISLDHAPGTPPVPWLVTNPIYVGRSEKESVAPARRVATEFAVQYEGGAPAGWSVETAPQAAGAIDVVRTIGGTQLRWRYALGGAKQDHPYTALVMPAGPAFAAYDRIMFTGRADKPMRVSVQVREPEGARWARSVYLDDVPRDITVFIDELTPRGVTAQRRPDVTRVQALLWVIESTNTALGSSGQVWIDNVKYGR